MSDYDNTNRGAAFAPFEDQRLILQGKINDEGTDRKVTFIKDKTKGGKAIIEVYEKIGVLFENEKNGNDNAPDYTGPFGETKRLAAWRKMKDDKPYMTLNISQQQGQQGQQSRPDTSVSVSAALGDDIPF